MIGLFYFFFFFFFFNDTATTEIYTLSLHDALPILLQLDFRSWKLASIVLFTIPFALVGGVVGTYLQGGVLSLGSLVGFVTVLGIAARNGIMLVSHYRHLEEVEGQEFGID